jgi:hypothetical protein
MDRLFISLVVLFFGWLGYLWLYLGLGGDLQGLILLLMRLAFLASVAAVSLRAFGNRRAAWSLLVLSWILSYAIMVVDAQQTAQENLQDEQAMAPIRSAENRLLLQDALIKAPCADGTTLTLNRRLLKNGLLSTSVYAIPLNLAKQNSLLAVVHPNDRPSIDSLDRRRIEGYASQGSQACQKGVTMILEKLAEFGQSTSSG